MVSLPDSQIPPSPSSTRIERSHGRSMRTIRSNLYQTAASPPSGVITDAVSEILTDSVVDFHLRELATAVGGPAAKSASSGAAAVELLELSREFSDFSSFSSDISGELQRLASVLDVRTPRIDEPDIRDPEFWCDSSLTSTLALDSATAAAVEPAVRSCVESLESASAPVEAKRAAAARIRLLAKHRQDFREMIGASGAIPALVPLLRSTDPAAQESAVTALLNLSLEEANKAPITAAGAIKPLVYALRTGTAVAKQNAACALLSLSMIEENRTKIGACGAIPLLVSLLVHGSTRGKKDALTTLYKLCSVRQNKERAVSSGAVTPLVALAGERGGGTAEKALVVLSSLAGIAEGQAAIVEEGGIPALVEAIEDGPAKGREFAVLTLLHLCSDSPQNRCLLVREGAIPPLVALSQSGSARAKHKAETLLGYLREPRQDGQSSAMASTLANKQTSQASGNLQASNGHKGTTIDRRTNKFRKLQVTCKPPMAIKGPQETGKQTSSSSFR